MVRYPVVAINANRDAVVAWDLQSGPSRKIMGITRQAGGAWEEDSKVLADGNFPSVVIDSRGRATASWIYTDGDLYEVRARARESGAVSWASTKTIASSMDVANSEISYQRLHLGPDGTPIVSWWHEPVSAGYPVFASASTQLPSGMWNDLGAQNVGIDPGSVITSVDPQGNVVLAWWNDGGDDASVVRVFDQTPPEISDVRIPTTGVAGARVSFSVKPFDTWSSVTVQWSFGGGMQATGNQVSHTFASPGTHTVKLIATDAAGNRAEVSRSITIKSPDVGKCAPARKRVKTLQAKVKRLSALVKRMNRNLKKIQSETQKKVIRSRRTKTKKSLSKQKKALRRARAEVRRVC